MTRYQMIDGVAREDEDGDWVRFDEAKEIIDNMESDNLDLSEENEDLQWEVDNALTDLEAVEDELLLIKQKIRKII